MLKKFIPLAIAVGLTGGLMGCADQEREFEGGGGGEAEIEREYNPLTDETETEGEFESEERGNTLNNNEGGVID